MLAHLEDEPGSRERVKRLHRTVRGWANYFSVGTRQQGVSGTRQLHRGAVRRWL
ncbi:group II intron maturase-specific domain-containing protein [Allomesorhizobium camelthorni]|uniref:group II intron maturase-specific domain-containing protein n=1 Tax=Allomesorhizobium camelthorni TaxID=475069 RepID=UPI003CCCB508